MRCGRCVKNLERGLVRARPWVYVARAVAALSRPLERAKSFRIRWAGPCGAMPPRGRGQNTEEVMKGMARLPN